MFYTVYKITNKINGKIYIGCHKTDDLDDNYMGSGKLIGYAKEKYGIENFEKEILAAFETEDQMFDEEKNLISKLDPDYNIHPGGNGGWGHIKEHGFKGKKGGIKQKNAAREWILANQNKLHIPSKKRDEYYKKFRYAFKNKSHTEETKKIIGEKNSKHQSGKGNSQYGTMWITNGTENKKIKKIDIIPEGWYKGRK